VHVQHQMISLISSDLRLCTATFAATAACLCILRYGHRNDLRRHIQASLRVEAHLPSSIWQQPAVAASAAVEGINVHNLLHDERAYHPSICYTARSVNPTQQLWLDVVKQALALSRRGETFCKSPNSTGAWVRYT
jgi:hypothetical protein